MIKRRSEMQTRVVEGARGGNGCVQFLDLMREEETLGKLRVACEITLEKGCSIGRQSIHNGPRRRGLRRRADEFYCAAVQTFGGELMFT